MIAFLSSLTFIIGLVVVAIISMIIALEKEKEGTATFILAVALGVVLWQNWFTVIDYVNTNFTETILFSFGYVVAGIVWSFIKWNEKIKEVFRKFKGIKDKFVKDNGVITDNNFRDFVHKLEYKFKDGDGTNTAFGSTKTMEDIGKKITPVGLEYKSLIISWISYWPLSVIGTLLNNPFRRLFEWIYDSLSGFYDNIANKHRNEAFKGM